MAEDRKIILTVDDVGMNLMIVKDILSPYFDVRVAKSGEIALGILKRLPIALILLDIEMPGMSGFELMSILRDIPELSKLPVIFVTSHANPATMQKTQEYGAEGVVTKPVNPEDLMEKVFRALGM